MRFLKIMLFTGLAMLLSKAATAGEITPIPPDTVLTGIYITSIHDIDFKDKEYTINLWLWMRYKRKEFDFLKNLEIPQAKNYTTAFSTVDTTGGQVYLIMKLQCVMKDNWKTDNFPFDRQSLRLSFENSQYDSTALIFAVDTLGDAYDKKYTLRGWDIDSCKISVKSKTYHSAFGVLQAKPESVYSSYRVRLVLKRATWGIFLKLFLGMYVAFLIAYVCFYIHADGIDSRFGLSVGALFAVIGNKYVIDSSLPETTNFTLVDILHEITLIFILAVIAATAYSLKLVKLNKMREGIRFDNISAQALLVIYVVLNVYFIWKAIHNH